MNIKTWSCLVGLLMMGQINLLQAQTSKQKETTYVGDQKNGQPDGKGVLTDTIGNVFKGSFKKGKKEGYGELTIKNAIGKDSTLVGYWKKDQYVGLYEYPYKIINYETKNYCWSSWIINAWTIQSCKCTN